MRSAVAQRKYATAQQALDQAKRFFDITQDAERAARPRTATSSRREIQYRQQEQAFEEAKLAMENARLDLAVLLFPTLNENFSDRGRSGFGRSRCRHFPRCKAWRGTRIPTCAWRSRRLRQADLDVSAAKGVVSSVAYRSTPITALRQMILPCMPSRRPIPTLGYLPTLGYFVTASLNMPVWDWGTLRSKLHQAEYKQEQARVELSQAQRQMLSNLYSSYNEAAVARAAVETSRHTADLAAESLRLVNLRYQAGESTALEVVDAENTLDAGAQCV